MKSKESTPDTAEKLTLTIDETAKLLGISRPLAYKIIGLGQLPSIRLGKRLLVPKKALEEMLEVPRRVTSNR
jgi:excisionase family DNA binding protein